MTGLYHAAFPINAVIIDILEIVQKVIICLCQVRNKKILFLSELQTASAYSSSDFAIILHKFKHIIMK